MLKYYLLEEIKNENYEKFIDYAFETCDSFMLVYFRYKGQKYGSNEKIIKEKLKKIKLKSRSNTVWPGTISWDKNEYRIIFYKINDMAKDILKSAGSIYRWNYNEYPADLCFFRGDDCWFSNTGHEELSTIINPTERDTEFVNLLGIEYRVENNDYDYKEEGLADLIKNKTN